MADDESVLPAKRVKLESNSSESPENVHQEDAEENLQEDKALEDLNGKEKMAGIFWSKSVSDNLEAAENCTENNFAAPCELPSRQVTEEDVGISEYIGTHQGFCGVLKQRYVDFVVKERNLRGQLIELTCTDLPVESRSKSSDTKNEEVSDEMREREQVLTDENMSKIREVAESKDKTASVTLTLAAVNSKEYRTRVHQAIKLDFPMLESETITTDANEKAIRVSKGRTIGGKRRQISWSHEGNYCFFVLYKENKDTMDAINLLAKLLKLNTKSFAYAGTKDRRAVTVQQVSAYKVSAERLHGLNNTLKNLCLGNFRYAKEPLQLGDLSGNHFVITLRNVIGRGEDITDAMLSLKNNGFINYYGLQRFGSTSIPTHYIGRAILCCNWAEVVDLILRPRSDDPKDLIRAREYWAATKDPKGTLNKIPRQKCMESKLLQGLIKYCSGSKNDFLGALQVLPRNMRLMYVHAYQSYVWNSMVTRRIKEYGLKPVVGDLVAVSDSVSGENEANINEAEAEDMDCGTESTSNRPSRIKVRHLTEKDLNSDTMQYSIYDVLMPLPGYDVIYPGNSMKDWYQELMAKDGLDVDQMRHKVKDYSLSGAYRSLLVKPKHFQWRLLRYNDSSAPLVLTDLDRMKGKVLDPGPLDDGKFCALQMEFTLSPSCYATMALREVMKCSTSSQYQSSLNS